jgi:hypothetical protein
MYVYIVFYANSCPFHRIPTKTRARTSYIKICASCTCVYANVIFISSTPVRPLCSRCTAERPFKHLSDIPVGQNDVYIYIYIYISVQWALPHRRTSFSCSCAHASVNVRICARVYVYVVYRPVIVIALLSVVNNSATRQRAQLMHRRRRCERTRRTTIPRSGLGFMCSIARAVRQDEGWNIRMRQNVRGTITFVRHDYCTATILLIIFMLIMFVGHDWIMRTRPIS